MDSTRQEKISKLLQKDIADIFQKYGRNYYGNTLTSITKVKVTKDLSIARIYLSIYTTEDKNAILNNVKSNTIEIRKRLAEKIRNQVRIIPELQFFLDDSLDYIENIEKLLKNT